MASRWAFEAIAVNQFKSNKFQKEFYEFEKAQSISNYKKTFWIAEVKSKIGFVETYYSKTEKREEVKDALDLLTYEIGKEGTLLQLPFEGLDKLNIDSIDDKTIKALRKYVKTLQKYYVKMGNKAMDARDDKIYKLQKKLGDKKAYIALKNDYENDNLTDLLKNKTEMKLIQEIDGQFVQRTDPIFLDPQGPRAHFFAPTKMIFGKRIDTFWFNTAVLWLMSLMLGVTLYFDIFKKVLDGLGKISSISFKK